MRFPMKTNIRQRGQGLTEVALLLMVVGLVFIAMEVYVKRGVQARIKDLSDNMIGKEHYLYTSDVSGMSVISSHSDTSSFSEERNTTFPGGGRSTEKNERAVSRSTSSSVYDP
jgi:hypothetical protein